MRKFKINDITIDGIIAYQKKNLWLNSAHGVYYVSVLEHFMVHFREGKWFSSEETKGSLFLCVLLGSVQTRSEGDGQFYSLD